MGFERMLAVLQDVSNVYETDAFRPIIARVEQLSGKEWGQNQEVDRSIRVVAEHARSASFLIGDGVIPGNSGRGYVLRRLIRRGMLFGRELGSDDPMLSKITDTVSDHMGHAYPELVSNRDFIKDVLEKEESSFSRTLEFGVQVLSGMIDYRSSNPDAAEQIKDGKKLTVPAGDDGRSVGIRQAIAELERLVAMGEQDAIDDWRSKISGTEAFVLYDTYGYPVEVTEEVAGEAGLKVDRSSFESEMEAQRQRGRASGGFGGNIESNRVYESLGIEDTPFVGYETLETETTVSAIVKDGAEVESASEGDEVELILDETPFYAARGGQVGDTGIISGDGVEISVNDTLAPYGHVNVHYGTVTSGSLTRGARVTASVDGDRRERIRRNHTATHLVHAALREIVGSHVRQAGSVVDPDRLRFDFTNMEALTREQIKAVQDRVNEKIRLNENPTEPRG
jgi:alanyl-tRNA synthetase